MVLTFAMKAIVLDTDALREVKIHPTRRPEILVSDALCPFHFHKNNTRLLCK